MFCHNPVARRAGNPYGMVFLERKYNILFRTVAVELVNKLTYPYLGTKTCRPQSCVCP